MRPISLIIIIIFTAVTIYLTPTATAPLGMLMRLRNPDHFTIDRIEQGCANCLSGENQCEVFEYYGRNATTKNILFFTYQTCVDEVSPFETTDYVMVDFLFMKYSDYRLMMIRTGILYTTNLFIIFTATMFVRWIVDELEKKDKLD